MPSSSAVLQAFQAGAGVSAGAMSFVAQLGLCALALVCAAWLVFRLLLGLHSGALTVREIVPYVVRSLLPTTLVLIFVLA